MKNTIHQKFLFVIPRKHVSSQFIIESVESIYFLLHESVSSGLASYHNICANSPLTDIEGGRVCLSCLQVSARPPPHIRRFVSINNCFYMSKLS